MAELITSKELVTLAKRTKINRMLKKTLKQCVVTWWNSVLMTLKSIAESADELRTVVSDGSNKQLLTKLCAIDKELLAQVINVLEPFDRATKELSTDTNSSLHLVVPTKYQLKRHLTPVASDSPVIASLKRRLGDHLEQYFTITETHMAATLLDFRLKARMDLMTHENRQRAIYRLRSLIADQKPNSSQPDTESPSKRPKLHEDGNFFGDLFATPIEESVIDKVELFE